jgi:GNAT superfamily N-acetyltransferase
MIFIPYILILTLLIILLIMIFQKLKLLFKKKVKIIKINNEYNIGIKETQINSISSFLKDSFKDDPEDCNLFNIRDKDELNEKIKNSIVKYIYYNGEIFNKVNEKDNNIIEGVAMILHDENKFHVNFLEIFYLGFYNILLFLKIKQIYNYSISKLKVNNAKLEVLKKYNVKKFINLWILGVDENYQKKGIGRNLLLHISNQYKNQFCILDTSKEENVIFYQFNGFHIENIIEFNEYKIWILCKIL